MLEVKHTSRFLDPVLLFWQDTIIIATISGWAGVFVVPACFVKRSGQTAAPFPRDHAQAATSTSPRSVYALVETTGYQLTSGNWIQWDLQTARPQKCRSCALENGPGNQVSVFFTDMVDTPNWAVPAC